MKSAVSPSILVQKICFWAHLKAHGYGFQDPYPYPHLPNVNHFQSSIMTCHLTQQPELNSKPYLTNTSNLTALNKKRKLDSVIGWF